MGRAVVRQDILWSKKYLRLSKSHPEKVRGGGQEVRKKMRIRGPASQVHAVIK